MARALIPFFAHTSCLSLQRMNAQPHIYVTFCSARRNYMLLFNLSCQGERARAFIALFVPPSTAWVNLLQVYIRRRICKVAPPEKTPHSGVRVIINLNIFPTGAPKLKYMHSGSRWRNKRARLSCEYACTEYTSVRNESLFIAQGIHVCLLAGIYSEITLCCKL